MWKRRKVGLVLLGGKVSERLLSGCAAAFGGTRTDLKNKCPPYLLVQLRKEIANITHRFLILPKFIPHASSAPDDSMMKMEEAPSIPLRSSHRL